MNKKIIFLLFNVAMMMQNDLYSMEQSEVDKEEEFINIADMVPDELLVHIIELATNSDAEIEFSSDRKSCFQFGPREENRDVLHDITLFSIHEWAPSINLNPESGFVNTRDRRHFLFPIQCWYSDDKPLLRVYSATKYVIEDDIQKMHFVTSANLEITEPFFDGPNKNNVFVIAGNSKSEENLSCGEEDYAHEEGLEKDDLQLVENQQAVYEYYVGRFTSDCKEFYESHNFSQKDTNKFDFISTRIVGSILALALCRTKNRFAIADQAGISLFEVKNCDELPCSPKRKKRKMNHEHETALRRIGFGSFHEDHRGDTIKKLSFITPKILLGLSEFGRLFSFGLDEESSSIRSEQQKISNKEKTYPIFLKNFAVNPCDSHQIILVTSFQLLYLNFMNCHDPKERKVGKVLLTGIESPKSVWFYDTNVCLVDYSSKVTNYSLADLDLRLKKQN